MLKKLKKKTIVSSLPLVIILLAIGILVLFAMRDDLQALLGGHAVFESLTPEEIQENRFVDASITVNFGAFLEEYEKNTSTNVTRTTSLYYIIWTGDDDSEDYRYMAIKVPASDESAMEAMAEATYNYEVSDPIQYSGVIKEMTSEEYRYFKEYFQTSDWTDEDIEQYTLPYYIDTEALAGTKAVTVYLIAAVCVALIVISIVLLIYALAGGKLKTLKKELAASGLDQTTVEYDYEGARLFCKKSDLRISSRLTFFIEKNKPHLIPNDRVVWAYRQDTNHKTNGVSTGTTYEVLIYTLDNLTPYHVNVSSDSEANATLQYMSQMMPRAIVRYSDDLAAMFRQNYQAFLTLAYNKPENPVPQDSEL